jgi:hypothetical protein
MEDMEIDVYKLTIMNLCDMLSADKIEMLIEYGENLLDL